MGKNSVELRVPMLAALLIVAAVLVSADCVSVQDTLPAPTAISPPPRRLTLEEARQFALTDNKSLGLAHLSIQEKRWIKAAAWKDSFPKVLGNVTYLHFNDNLVLLR